MFGLTALFHAIARLTAAVTKSAEIFENVNQQLAVRLNLEETTAIPVLEHEPEPVGNGRRRK